MASLALKAQIAVAALTTPALLGLSAVSRPLVLTLFGDDWAPTTPLLAVLALAGLGIPYQVINLSALMALGRSRCFFVMHAAKKCAAVALLVFAAYHGAQAMAWAVVAGAAIGAAVDLIVPGRLLGLTAWTQVRAVLPIAGAGAIMWVAVSAVIAVFKLPAPIELAIGVATGAIVYGALALVLKVRPITQLVGRALQQET